LLKRSENVGIAVKGGPFNDTELRLLRAILEAKSHGERIISTRLADKLGVTRSAISQIVNRLEKEGIVRRVADDVDRKIAYIEASEEVVEKYEAEIKMHAALTGNIIKKYGAEKFQILCEMSNEFFDIIDEEKKNFHAKKRK
jgi:DNA-binding MarR family transcriptional regulator